MAGTLIGLRYLVDTNVLVYAHDGSDATKQACAVEVLAQLAGTAALSVQALSEFSSVALRKMDPPMSARALYKELESLEVAFPILPVTPAVVLEAVRGVRDYKLSYYDAQVWAVARLAQIPILLSEDFASGGILEGVTFMNPFSPEVEISAL